MPSISLDQSRITTERIWRWCKIVLPPRRFRAKKVALRSCRPRSRRPAVRCGSSGGRECRGTLSAAARWLPTAVLHPVPDRIAVARRRVTLVTAESPGDLVKEDALPCVVDCGQGPPGWCGDQCADRDAACGAKVTGRLQRPGHAKARAEAPSGRPTSPGTTISGTTPAAPRPGRPRLPHPRPTESRR